MLKEFSHLRPIHSLSLSFVISVDTVLLLALASIVWTLQSHWFHERLLVSNPAFFKSNSHRSVSGIVAICDLNFLLNGFVLCTGKPSKAHFLEKFNGCINCLGVDKSKLSEAALTHDFSHIFWIKSHSLAIFGNHETNQLKKSGMLLTYRGGNERAEDVFLEFFIFYI